MSRRLRTPDTDADIALREILSQDSPPNFIVTAGAGSGKTTSLVKALAHLRHHRGVALRGAGKKVACITYTEVAANEIVEDVGDDPLFFVTTIHSFLWALVKPFRSDIAEWVRGNIDRKIGDLREHNAKSGTREKTKERNLASITHLESEALALHGSKAFTYGTGSRYSEGILGHDDIIKMVPALLDQNSVLRAICAQRFPFIFVDESQDTFESVVDALKKISSETDQCVGYFGDPMQQIYTSGVGEIEKQDDWVSVPKPQNFRCPSKILSVINGIRSQVPGSLLQEGGRTENVDGAKELVHGSARLFVLPLEGDRDKHLQRVREWLATEGNDALWNADDPVDAGVRVLVIEHRLAAKRLGFTQLFAALHDKSTTSIKEGLLDGTAWPTAPFVGFLLPLLDSVETGRDFEQIRLLRAHSPLLARIRSREESPTDVFAALAAASSGFADLFSAGKDPTVRDVLLFAVNEGLLQLDERFDRYTDLLEDEATANEEDAEEDVELGVIRRFLGCPANELRSYKSYLSEHSAFATHQGVKGAEFERVLVILEDDASRHNQFSYDKLLGIKPLSPADEKRAQEGLDTVVDRTRRLFYVCCSRAIQSLAVVLYASDPEEAVSVVRGSKVFEEDQIYSFLNISRKN